MPTPNSASWKPRPKALGLGLAGLAAAGALHAAKPDTRVFADAPDAPVTTALKQNQQVARRREVTPGKFAAETFLDRLVNNGLGGQYETAKLKRVATRQTLAVQEYFRGQHQPFTIEAFENLRGDNTLAKTLGDIEREILGATALPDHTEIFFGTASRAEKTRRQNARAVQSFNESGWKQARSVLSQYNFDSRTIFRDVPGEAEVRRTTPGTSEQAPVSPLVPVTLFTVAAGALSLAAYHVRTQRDKWRQSPTQTPGWSKPKFWSMQMPTFRAWTQKAREALRNPFASKATVANSPTQVATPQTADLDDWRVTQSDPVWDDAPTNTDPVVPSDILVDNSVSKSKPTPDQIRARYAATTKAALQFTTPSPTDTLDFQAAANLQTAVQKAETTLGPEGRTKAELLRLQALVPRLETAAALDASEAEYVTLEIDDLLHRHQNGEDTAEEVERLAEYIRTVRDTDLENKRFDATREQAALQSLQAKLTRVETQIASVESRVEEQRLATEQNHQTRGHLLEYRLLEEVLNQHVAILQDKIDKETQDHRDRVFRATVGVEYLTSVAERLLQLKAQTLAQARTARAERERRRQIDYEQKKLRSIEDKVEILDDKIQRVLEAATTQEAKATRSKENKARIAQVQEVYRLLHTTKDIFEAAEYEDLRGQLAEAYKSGDPAEVAFVVQSIADRAPEVLAEKTAAKETHLTELTTAVTDFRSELDTSTLPDARYQAYYDELQTLVSNLTGRDPRTVRSKVIALHRTLQEELYNPTTPRMFPTPNQPKFTPTPEPKITRAEAKQREELVEAIDFLDREITEAQADLGLETTGLLRTKLQLIKSNEDREALRLLQEEFEDLRAHQTSRAAYFTQDEPFGPGLEYRNPVAPSIPMGEAAEPTAPKAQATPDEFRALLESLKTKARPGTLDLPREGFTADLQAIEAEYYQDPAKFVAEATSFDTGEEFGPFPQSQWTPKDIAEPTEPAAPEVTLREVEGQQIALTKRLRELVAEGKLSANESRTYASSAMQQVLQFMNGSNPEALEKLQAIEKQIDEAISRQNNIFNIENTQVDISLYQPRILRNKNLDSITQKERYEATREFVTKKLLSEENWHPSTLDPSTLRVTDSNERKVEVLKQARELYFGDLGGSTGLSKVIDLGLVNEQIELDPGAYEIINDDTFRWTYDAVYKVMEELAITAKEWSQMDTISSDEAQDQTKIYQALTLPLSNQDNFDLVDTVFAKKLEANKASTDKSVKREVKFLYTNLQKLVDTYHKCLQIPAGLEVDKLDGGQILQLVRQCHQLQINAAAEVKWNPSEKEILLCGDTINDRYGSDLVTLNFLSSLKKQARTAGYKSPVTITLSNHDIGIIYALFPGFGHKYAGYSSDKAAYLSRSSSRELYLEHIRDLQLFHYDPEKQLLLAHILFYPDARYDEENGNYIYSDKVGDIVQKIAIDKLPFSEVQSVEDMQQVVKTMNNFYQESITLLGDLNQREEYTKRHEILLDLVETRPLFEFNEKTYQHYKFKQAVKHVAHGHDKTVSTQSIIYDMNNTALEENGFDKWQKKENENQSVYSAHPNYKQDKINFHDLQNDTLFVV